MMKRILAALLLCLLLTSCGAADDADVVSQIPEFSIETASETFPWIDSIDAGDWLGMNELYMEWTQGGNPDFYENAVAYEFEDAAGVLDMELQDRYTLADEYWTLRIVPTTEATSGIKEWSHMLNLEKLENGEWVRQCVLWDLETYGMTGQSYAQYPGPTGAFPLGTGFLLGNRALQIEVARIYQAPEAGQYRFIFYVAFRNDGETEYRQYYIPFEVTE